jgi:enoyl-CoA hydratase/carnithine racemase
VRLGIFPGAGGTQRLARQVGKSKAMEMILTGDINLTAAEALASGLVARVVPSSELLETAMKLARKIAANSTLSVRMAKEAINRVYESSLAEGLLFERRLFYASLATDDKAEGTKAFLENRKPFFRDR